MTKRSKRFKLVTLRVRSSPQLYIYANKFLSQKCRTITTAIGSRENHLIPQNIR